ncbi:Nuclear aminoacylation-dependent tRNA export pathway component [Emydomyces testavorans]|uniref:Nuclear aminoacylation-dependent tRNA export pathway component n=1 Tax=Emydomyces testavorans TaxID=2070801 RepID=A0AAF0IF78_9EURO|nr:Nuclear aminoacylation-dependent tRNA export pathway component [Emydomyces testavorans]
MQSTPNRPLDGKVGIVTGGSRGKYSIGAAIAENLASKGCHLLLIYTSPSSTTRVHELCQKLETTHFVHCVAQQADLRDPITAVDTILSAAKHHFTAPDTQRFQVDILINNAGIAENRLLNDPEKGPIDVEMFNRQYTVNVLAPLLLTQAVAPYLPRDRSGRIVNVSSVSASLGLASQSVYAGTKGALEAMTRTWARELGDCATVNSVNPGPVVGDMYWEAGEGFWRRMQGWQDNAPGSNMRVGPGFAGTGEERLGEEEGRTVREKMGGRRPGFADEVAGVVGMLCTKDGGWCTGSVVCANGGLRMSP